MTSDFRIIISAQDKATASIRKVNDSMSRITRPLTEAHRSTVAMGKELAKNPVVNGLLRVKSAAEGAAAGIMKIAGPMLGLTGIGIAAGVAQLATSWGRLGFELKTTSNSLGISTQALQTMHGVAKLASVSTESMTSALGGLNQNLFNAKNGNDPELVGVMKNLGISFHETADGGFDTIRVLEDLNRAMAAQKTVGAKHAISQRFGVDGIYSIVEKAERLNKLKAEYQKIGGTASSSSIDQADKFTEALNRLSIAADGVKNSLGEKLIPAVQPLIERLTGLISAGTQKIETATPAQVNGAKSALSLAIPAPIRAAGSVWGKLLDRMGMGEKNNPAPLSNPIGAPATAPSIAPPSESLKKLPYNDPRLNAYAASVEKKMGLWPNFLNGIKNFGERSNSDQVSPAGAKGIMQFMPGTWAQYGKGDITDPIASIDAAGRYGKDLMRRYGGNRDAATTEYNGGVLQAREVKRGGQPWKADTANYLSRVKSGIESMNAAESGAQPQNMTITLAGLPGGVTATAKSASGKDVPVRISRAMPSENPL